ncbi:MAG: YciI-like protein [Solirubrobacteraceae bacterium]
MGHLVLEYALVRDYVERRAPLRGEHLALARQANEAGDLLLAGALSEPVDRALFVWSTDDRSVVERFAASDPYVREGLVTSWTVRAWTVVVGAGAAPV